ncbi:MULTISPECIES: PIN domain-containing protein [unclassified Undibacterium]|uniref:PIN domain-containing protein n=1 Tax=unclassified Undibacterium TaxID=2630295 RepID=UPI002B22FDFD|nr:MULTISPECIES: PIN domain-containing protein [unclassified Undibacterium]
MCGSTIIDSFLADSGTLVLNSDDYINVSDLLSSYFGNEPPFQKENNKKSEFPDAIALKTLENWALDEDTEIVVVSRDGDWISYCEISDRLHHVKELATALALFQTPDEAVQHMIKGLRRDLNDGNSKIFLRIEEEIKDFEWSEAVISDVYSQFEYEEDEFYVELNKCTFEDVPNAIKVTDIDQEGVSVIFSLQVQGTFIGSYSFQKWDGIDKEYISMGNGLVTDNFDESVSIVLRIPNKSNEVDDIELEIEPNTLHFEFGEIEPDWMSGRDNVD